MAIRNLKKTFQTVTGQTQDNEAAEKVANMMNSGNDVQKNPFLNQKGEIAIPGIDYQSMLNSPKVSAKVKALVAEATGLSPTVSATTTTGSGSGNGIVSAAEKYLGTPYVWGGESMAEGGMDCSGFVYNALKDAGYQVGRTTAQGYRDYGTSVSKSEMQPGDLVFFGSGNNASHIGIYIGNGQMIHSSGGSKNTASNPGKGVTVTNVDYRNDFLEARRYEN